MDPVLLSFWNAMYHTIRPDQTSYSIEQMRYRYPALSPLERSIEAYMQSLERSDLHSSLSCLYEMQPGASGKIRYTQTLCAKELEILPDENSEPCSMPSEPTIDDEIRFSVSRKEPSDEPDFDFEAEQERIKQEIRERIDKLRQLGVDELVLRKLFEKEDTLSRLVITSDYRIMLPDYHNMEIVMTPLPKAIFLLYLRHEEGISFKFLSDYEQELRELYLQLTDRVQNNVIDKSIHDLCDPTQNAINEKCSRIREAFVREFDERLAQHYFITGKRGEVKRIRIRRDMVEWEDLTAKNTLS